VIQPTSAITATSRERSWFSGDVQVGPRRPMKQPTS